MAMVWVVCANPKCKIRFQAREADIARGWGKFHNKSCKASVQESRTKQYANLIQARRNIDDLEYDDGHDDFHSNIIVDNSNTWLEDDC